MGYALEKVRVLIVEDEALLAFDLELILTANGCAVVGPIATVAAAVRHIEGATLDAAVLDLNLNGESGVPVADALAARGIPFVFLSGYDRSHLPARYRDAPLLAKPYRDCELLGTLDRCVHSAA